MPKNVLIVFVYQQYIWFFVFRGMHVHGQRK